MAVKKRIEYIVTMKAIAIFAVIWIHVALLWSGVISDGITFDSIAEIGRFAVPLFLMVSGALLLNREDELRSFFSRRFTRIIYPYILWVIPLILFFLAINNFHWNTNLVISKFFYRWYFWMILGIYCAIPVINEFVKNKGMEGVKYFLILCIIAIIFYQICKYFQLTTYLDLRFFVGPLVYIMLGYYLDNYEFKLSSNKVLTISLILFILTTLLKMTNVCGLGVGFLNFANPRIFLDSNLDANIFGYIRAGAIFVFIKFLYEEDTNIIYSSIRKILDFGIIKRFIKSVAKASYGIYLSMT